MADASDELRHAEENYLSAWRDLASAADGGEAIDDGAVLLTTVPLPVPFFNSAFVSSSVDLASTIETIRAFYAARDRPFTVRFRADDEAQALLADAGLGPGGSSPLMVAPIDEIVPAAAADVRVVDATTWAVHVAVMAAGFGMPIEVLTAVLSPTLLERGYVAVLAYDGDEPISTASLMASGTTAGVYNVATPDAHRRRGAGELVTRAVVDLGRERGCRLTTLQASEMGYPIYERMGYRTVTTWQAMVSSAP